MKKRRPHVLFQNMERDDLAMGKKRREKRKREER